MSNSRPSVDRFDHLFIAPADFDKSLAFYRDVLGWAVVTTWGDEGEGRGAVLSGGGIKVVIAEQHGATSPDMARTARARTCTSTSTTSTSRFKLLPKGDHVVVEPEETHWGTRWFVVRDPDGNLIAFEEHPRRWLSACCACRGAFPSLRRSASSRLSRPRGPGAARARRRAPGATSATASWWRPKPRTSGATSPAPTRSASRASTGCWTIRRST